MYSINVSGYIPIQKSKEFRQHMKQIIGHQNDEIADIFVQQDLMNEDLYHVKVAFRDKKRMLLFMKSDDYALISGSFKVLGMLRDQHLEEFSDIIEKKDL